jgi:hypothetical protein
MTRNEILDTLIRLYHSELNLIIEMCEMPHQLQQGSTANVVERSIEFLKWSETITGCGLEKVKTELTQYVQKGHQKLTSANNLSHRLVLPTPEPLYLMRPSDEILAKELNLRHRVISIEGPKHSGKKTMLNQTLLQNAVQNKRYVLINFHKFTGHQIKSIESFLLSIAQTVSYQLKRQFKGVWRKEYSATLNFEEYLEKELLEFSGDLVLVFNEIDEIYSLPFATDFFCFIRALHDNEKDKPTMHWKKLNFIFTHILPITIIYQGELNRSPFNIGKQILIEDFIQEQIRNLNTRFGSPLEEGDFSKFYNLLGGVPCLTQTGLFILASEDNSFNKLSQIALNNDGPFGNHLMTLLLKCKRNSGLHHAVLALFNDVNAITSDGLNKLKSAGIIKEEMAKGITFRCGLYETYLRRHLLELDS